MRAYLVGSVLLLWSATAGAEPPWCKGVTEKINVSDSDWKDFQERDDPRHAVRTLVGAHCFPNDDTRRDAKIIAEGFAKWSRKLEMTEADWADAVAYTNARYGGSLSHRDPKLAWSTWTPVDQYVGIKGSTTGVTTQVVDPLYLADAIGARLGELGRAAYVGTCIAGESVAGWAICQPDIDALDRKKLAAELREDKSYDGYVKMSIRMELLDAADKLEKHAARVKELRGKDPAYGKMFDLAAAAQKEWATQADPRFVELASAMDDARVTGSRRASEGCKEKTWTAFKEVVGAIPAKSFADLIHDPLKANTSALNQAMAIVVGTPNGYLTSLAHYSCAGLEEKQDYLARTLGALMARWPGYRGPRTASHMAIVLANLELDDRDAKIQYPDILRPWIAGSGSSGGGGFGEVASVKTSGEQATIAFAKVKSKQQECTKGNHTNRVRQIRDDGTIVYEYRCQSWKTVTIDEPPFQAQTVNARYANGVKKGMQVHVVEDVVTVAYPKPGATTPAAVVGVPLK
jgi:hypothetical protein